MYSSAGSVKILQVQDALLHVGYRPLILSAAVLEIGMAAFLLNNRNTLLRSLVLIWLSGNFLFYHWGGYLLGVYLCPCLGRLTDNLPLPRGFAEVMLQLLVLYWFLGSINMIWQPWGSAQWARMVGAAKTLFAAHRARPTGA